MATMTFRESYNPGYSNPLPNVFTWAGSFEERLIPKGAGFRWNPDQRCWWTTDVAKAESLRRYADAKALAALDAHKKALEASRATDSDVEIPCPEGLEYLPYQRAGIAYMLSVFGGSIDGGEAM